ncbi:MAG TPA: phenylalanine--tRNA ligase subunit beta [Phycisphaerae bacterium]|nr:phenylalanine--tRNA ligase subunit beta [Phycisphaerae bacterium]HRY66400.1 phenylalanine--tRNA ligase subunit beta [Phycisphaerae bacterium]HSA25893.1 phenylalanine--tRNA ligase subunit beta [Phycisphaerae bacterium]
MFVSFNWIRDFVDLPTDLDARVLAEHFTVTSAEVEGVEQISCGALGLIAAEVVALEAIAGSAGQLVVKVNTGSAQLDTVTIAQGLKVGDRVVFAPPGAVLAGVGVVGERKVSGHRSAGMIVPGDALSLPTVGQRALWLPPATRAGEKIDMALFNDWVMEIDNKSITNRPDLWGHYGVARELAAIHGRPLKSYPVAPLDEVDDKSQPGVPIVIDDPARCPRYSALRFTGVRAQPAPLWMQVRLAHVGMRPIDILVDLTNYIMAELGQPMHAFDCSTIDRIEVATAKTGEQFTTLDGTARTMPEGALMIQSNRRSVALAGIMGGADTEVTAKTESLLLESANFDPAVIRRCATALGHRTDASARFEKSLDPATTVLGIQRFVYLAKPELPGMKFTSRLSDCFPRPPKTTTVRVDPEFVSMYVGRPVSADEISRILKPLEFGVRSEGKVLDVTVPSFRATKDISIEADVIEEVARFIGYGSIEPVLPTITVRYAEPTDQARFERQTLSLLCGGMSYAEIHRHVWFTADWLKQIGYEPGECITLRNPAAAGTERLRTTLIPGMLAAVDLNRHHFEKFDLVEVGSVFSAKAAEGKAGDAERERRHMALALVAPGRKSTHEDELLRRLKTDLTTWLYQTLKYPLRFVPAEPSYPWEHEAKTAAVEFDGKPLGRITVLPAATKRRIDEHLAAWSIALAEVDLSAVLSLRPLHRRLVPVPVHPQIDLDFSLLAASGCRYPELEKTLAGYSHALLRRFAFVDSYEGGSVPAGKRSFTFRATIGDAARTLTEEDIQGFRADFLGFIEKNGLALRT